MLIKLTEAMLKYEPLKKLIDSISLADAIVLPTGEDGDDMEAVLEIAAVFKELDSLLQSYRDLVLFDVGRIKTAIELLVASDKA